MHKHLARGNLLKFPVSDFAGVSKMNANMNMLHMSRKTVTEISCSGSSFTNGNLSKFHMKQQEENVSANISQTYFHFSSFRFIFHFQNVVVYP